MVVEAFATLVDRFVFQPTYLLNETSRLREILCQQASTDPGRERFARGILLSMSSDSQEVNSKDGEDVLDSVLDELLRNSMKAFDRASETSPTDMGVETPDPTRDDSFDELLPPASPDSPRDLLSQLMVYVPSCKAMQ